MSKAGIVSHQARPVLEELRELREIARREHGPTARSTRLIDACLEKEERAQRASLVAPASASPVPVPRRPGSR